MEEKNVFSLRIYNEYNNDKLATLQTYCLQPYHFGITKGYDQLSDHVVVFSFRFIPLS